MPGKSSELTRIAHLLNEYRGKFALRLVGAYFLIAGAYIILSDWLLVTGHPPLSQLQLWSTLKGLGFVLVTGGLMYYLVQKEEASRNQAERSRLQTAALMEKIVDTGMVSILMIDGNGIINYANRYASEMLGVTPEHLLGKSYQDLPVRMLTEGGEVVPDGDYVFQRVVTSKKPVYETRRMVERTDGKRIMLTVNASPLPLNGGEHAVVLVLVDTTAQYHHQQELERLNQALTESEENLRALFEQAVDSILITNSSGELLAVNSTAMQMLDYTTEEISRLKLDNLIAAEDEWGGLARVANELAYGRTYLKRCRLVCKGGGTIPAEVSIKMLSDGRIQAIARDLRPRERSERELREQKEVLEMILDNLPVIVTFFNTQGKVILANASLERILGYTVEEAINGDYLELAYPDEARRREAINWILQAEGLWGKFTVLRKDRVPRELMWTNIRLKDNRLVGIGMDVTENIRVQESLRQSMEAVRSLTMRQAEIEETERKRLSRELHDQVGQELTALNINLGLIRGMLDRDEIVQAVNRLEDSSSLVQQTIDHIRNVMSELTPPMLEEYGLAATLTWFAEQFSARTNIQAKISSDELIPPLSSGTAITLFRIAQEAFNNTAKHAHADRVKIEVINGGERVRMIISDNGRGFEPRETSGPGTHSGWGLRIMNERAVSIGGTFRVQSQPGAGTQIIIEAPR